MVRWGEGGGGEGVWKGSDVRMVRKGGTWEWERGRWSSERGKGGGRKGREIGGERVWKGGRVRQLIEGGIMSERREMKYGQEKQIDILHALGQTSCNCPLPPPHPSHTHTHTHTHTSPNHPQVPPGGLWLHDLYWKQWSTPRGGCHGDRKAGLGGCGCAVRQPEL